MVGTNSTAMPTEMGLLKKHPKASSPSNIAKYIGFLLTR